MADVRRVYVVKREGFDTEARGMLADLRENLGAVELSGLRVAHRYDVQGLSDEEYLKARDMIFREPMVDDAFDEELPAAPGETAFATEYLPGQYDQRADSAGQCIALITGRSGVVRTARVYLLLGDLSPQTLSRIKDYVINPVESREATLDKPSSLEDDYPAAPDVATLHGFVSMDEDTLSALLGSMGMAMTDADLRFVQRYFRDEEHRDPTATELRMIDTYWSDHCRHTTFLTTLDEVTFDKEGLATAIEQSFLAYLADREELGRTNPPCLMDVALTGPRILRARGQLAGVDESEEINACSITATIQVDGEEQDWLIMFKNETHNHPTEIEPFGGAATCLGGAIRDPLSGRSYVYQAMRVTGSGDPTGDASDTLPGKLSQRKITTGAAAGFSSYGNQIGLATGQVTEIYHPGYVAKRLEIGAVIGAAPRENVVRERPAPGDAVVLLGGRTGRDGCGGATGSSKAHTLESLEECGAEVQKGNPVTERKLQRLFRNPAITRLIKRCNDFGAGGVSVAIGELADGLTIDLDKVPKKYEGLDGTELAISESQERMAVVVSPADVDALIAGADAENLEATVVATVSEEPRLRMMFRGNTIVDVARSFLDTNGAEQHARAHVVSPDPLAHPYAGLLQNTQENWLLAVSDLNAASQQGLTERFDGSIGASSVLMPFGGAHQKTPAQAMAAKLPVRGVTTAATIMAHGFDPYLSSWSPYHGAIAAVVESLARLVAAGGDHERAYLTFQEYFERLREEPARWGKPVAALLGALEAQKQLGVASIGGKDSMSGSFVDLDVPPTLTSFAVCAADSGDVCSGEFKKAGSRIVYLPTRLDENLTPDFAYQKALFAAVRDGIRAGAILSAYTVGVGGIAAAVTKMAFGNALGANLDNLPSGALFHPNYGSFVLEVDGEWSPGALDRVELGTVSDAPIIRAGDVTLPVDALLSAYEKPLSGVFPITGPALEGDIPAVYAASAPTIVRARPIAKPRVFIPAFPGTNCEIDTARAFEKAGAVTDVCVVRNRNAQQIEESVAAFEKGIRGAQIIALPGGFSAGDEPEGSAKFIVSFMNHPRLRDAVMDLLRQRDGLMLGICNGFQALVKLGLAVHGEYRAMAEGAPTLTYNTVGRHISHIVETRVASKLSPWYLLCEVGERHKVAVSHGEGRFVASDDMLQTLSAAGQIATQYVDANGNAGMNPRYNVNGSAFAIEGICSPDGRILGKMGHSERSIDSDVFKNIPGAKDDKIFRSGVLYYQ
jgi:phosphoribosylformylglycinamidine synthase